MCGSWCKFEQLSARIIMKQIERARAAKPFELVVINLVRTPAHDATRTGGRHDITERHCSAAQLACQDNLSNISRLLAALLACRV